MAGPSLFIKNALRASSLGLGDGTIYASGTVNLEADISQANSTFTLTGFTLDALTGADTDDLMNGYLLYFPASGNKYHVVDWVAATDTATTHEMPQITDTGACEFRRALFDNKALVSNPLLYAADGRRDKKWKRSAFGDITIALDNLVQNPGFETGTTSGWAVIAGPVSINTTSPILGSSDVLIGAGGRIWALLRGPIKKTTYRILFKARAATWADGLAVVLHSFGFNIFLDYTFTNPSSGSLSGLNRWIPGLTSSNAWHWVDVTFNTAQPDGCNMTFDNIFGTPHPFNLDEVYVFEKINVDTFMLFDEFDSRSNSVVITGQNAPGDRAGITAGIDDSVLSTSVVSHHNVLGFTGGIFPIYKIGFAILPPSGSEILLCEKWAWEFNPDMPFDADSIEYDEKSIKSRSGVESIIRHSKKRTIKGKYSSMSAIERAILKNDLFPHHIDEERYPFAYRLNPTDTPLFVRVSQSKFGLNRSSGLRDDWDFAFDEVL